MWYEDIFKQLEELRDPVRAVQMGAYMRNQFPFLGIAAAPRKAVYQKEFHKALKEKIIDFHFVEVCFSKSEREFHYAGVDYLLAIQSILLPEDLMKIKKYITMKSWWDTVDGLDGVVGSLVLRYPELKETMVEWSLEDNIWIRRVAIDHQLLFKEKTDTDLLAQIIQNNLNDTEFFINKAIGWSLRDYSKTNPVWVRNFINENKPSMAPLSIREGSKYIIK
ncbi:DNA alkylation repair protein [Desemzia sp. FAM 24101]|uniref:DNA alkylation repair protein n=1 Tax=unclassified Desemzia TaxID=2685243 RepID=UPI00388633A6